ncbi:hypothetical protein KCP69_12030 [Salmonella enterica subsp. enterica]|nr:hypothetical protein KCP69_12030 [Salmonella enterica subsp. enterica]
MIKAETMERNVTLVLYVASLSSVSCFLTLAPLDCRRRLISIRTVRRDRSRSTLVTGDSRYCGAG